ncbi:hypothetical protein Tsp_09632 [Trichinella spiralis]|uniref:hypothetical protein n=1 Tax=Trichinella spiralis TaxID=6334 RepID=UPI0001EFF044|nr:hypothetical protein Tsp_09632 [Trichinella spiralis]
MMMKNNILHSSSSNCSAVVGDVTNSNVNLDRLLQILEICQLQRNPTGVIFGKWSTLNDQKYQSGCCHSLRNGIGRNESKTTTTTTTLPPLLLLLLMLLNAYNQQLRTESKYHARISQLTTFGFKFSKLDTGQTEDGLSFRNAFLRNYPFCQLETRAHTEHKTEGKQAQTGH